LEYDHGHRVCGGWTFFCCSPDQGVLRWMVECGNSPAAALSATGASTPSSTPTPTEIAATARRMSGSGACRSRSGIKVQCCIVCMLLRLAVSGLAAHPFMMEPPVLSEDQIKRLMCKGGRLAVRERVCNLCMDRYVIHKDETPLTSSTMAPHAISSISHCLIHLENCHDSLGCFVRSCSSFLLLPLLLLLLPHALCRPSFPLPIQGRCGDRFPRKGARGGTE
jgi:hypothetical protein